MKHDELRQERQASRASSIEKLRALRFQMKQTIHALERLELGLEQRGAQWRSK